MNDIMKTKKCVGKLVKRNVLIKNIACEEQEKIKKRFM